MEVRESQRSPYARPGFVASATLVGMLVLAAMFVAIGAATRQTSKHVTGIEVHRAPVATVPTRTQTGSGCSLPAGGQQVPTAPPSVGWVSVGQMQTPQSPTTLGPQHERRGIGVCFAHSPTGSLLAAINFFAQATVASPVKLIEVLVADTPERQVALTQAREGQDQLLQDSDGDPGSVQVSGFQVVDYTPAQANVNVVLEGPEGELAAVECRLDWRDSDWKFVVPSGGQLDSAQVTSLDGFVSWSAGAEG